MPRPTLATEKKSPDNFVFEKESCIICFEEFKTIESEVVILECGNLKKINHNEHDVRGQKEIVKLCSKGHVYETVNWSPYPGDNRCAAICDKCKCEIEFGD